MTPMLAAEPTANAAPSRPPMAEDFLERLRREERRLFDQLEDIRDRLSALNSYEVLRARLSWDDDRRLEAEELGSRLARRPSAIRAKLARSKQGALWLIARWTALAGIIERNGTWTEAQTRLAFDLLGVDKDLREGDPWAVAGLDGPAALAAREIATLQEAASGRLEDLDEFERTAARAGLSHALSPAMKSLRREESDAWSRLQSVQRAMASEARRRIDAVPHDPAPENRTVAEDPPPRPVTTPPQS
ncbi:MAG: hypothetical protein K2X91_18315, partial [Thermoleophilia bacterium]|nr:hypothetical protein [Thermoleophilia bacterium]